MNEHFTLEDFEQFDFGPCVCGCGNWVEWDDETDKWKECDDPYRYLIVEPTDGDSGHGGEVVAWVVRIG